jgi:hypothetical protein
LTDSFWDRRWFEKPVQESGAAREILRHAGFEISKFGPRQDDPPDCEGFLDRQWSAVEVTRLTHEKTRALSMKAISQGKPPYYYEWDLILTFGPLSGAHFNPAVSVAFARRGEIQWRDAGYYVAAQSSAQSSGCGLRI